MLIKSMSRKTPSFAQLHDYIMRHTETGPPLVIHNAPESASDRSGRLKAFFDNDRSMKLRKNGVRVFHEVLSFHAEDAPALTKDAIRKLTEYYLQLRAPHALAFAEAHFDTANPHVHIMLSANELNSNKRLRVSKREFADIKTAVERLQIELYPNLTKSVCQHLKHSFWQRSKDFGQRLAASLSVNEKELSILSKRFAPHTLSSTIRQFLQGERSNIDRSKRQGLFKKVKDRFGNQRGR